MMEKGTRARVRELGYGYQLHDQKSDELQSKTEEGYAKMKNILAGTPDPVAVFCENDPMAVGAAQAVAEAGKTGQVLVIGFNADVVALESIRAGTMAATVAQFPSLKPFAS